jgi:diguanylate cyclase
MSSILLNRKPQPKTVPLEFAERVSNLLLICIDGLRSQLGKTDALKSELDNLEKVLLKVVRVRKSTEITSEIEGLFKGKKLESLFQESQELGTKEIVLSMANVLNDVVTGVGGYETHLTGYIENIKSSDSLDEILAIKDHIVKEAKTFKENTIKLKTELESSRQTIIDMSRELENTKSKTLIDPLTKVLNRNAYDIRVNQMIHEYKRYKEPISLILVDIDHLKKFNDKYGHRTGDKILHAVATTIQHPIRSSDLVFRYGGEEFTILLKRASLGRAQKISEKIRQHVENEHYIDQGKKFKATISLGVTSIKEEDTEETLFTRANQALCVAKDNGRNRVDVHKSQSGSLCGKGQWKKPSRSCRITPPGQYAPDQANR